MGIIIQIFVEFDEVWRTNNQFQNQQPLKMQIQNKNGGISLWEDLWDLDDNESTWLTQSCNLKLIINFI